MVTPGFDSPAGATDKLKMIRTEYYNNRLCVEGGWLCKNVVSKDYYDKLSKRKQWNIIRRGCKGTPALIEWDSVPDRIKNEVIDKFGNPKDQVIENIIEKHLSHDPEAAQFYDRHILANGRHINPATRKEYYNQAIIFNAIREILNDAKGIQRACGGKVSLWEKLTLALDDMDKEIYPHSLPSCWRRLKLKYQRYINEGYESLVHGGHGHKNSAKIDDEEKESLMIELLSDPRNLDNEQIRSLYNIVASKLGWKLITASAVAYWRKKYELEINPGRRGITQFRNTRTMQIRRSKPSAPLLYWTLDGWDAELLYQKTSYDNKKGSMVTTYHNRLTLVVVLDPCVKYPIGYAIGTHETPELITAALRNAIKHTEELFGKRYKVHQLQSDHYSIKKLTPVYEAVAKHFTPAQVKNAKAKVVEPYFKYINKKYCQLQSNWAGFGVTSVKENQPNVDFLNKFKHNFPDQEGCRRQLEEIMAMERMNKYQSYMDLWNKETGVRLELSTEDYLYYFGECSHQNRLEPQGLTPTINGVERFYDCFDINFRRYSHERWTVKYDPDDLTTALAINEDGTLRFMLQSAHIQPMALYDYKEGDGEERQRVKEFNAELENYITEKRSYTSQTVHDLFEENPILDDTLSKLILADSTGNHKDNRNQQRMLQAAQKAKYKEIREQEISSSKEFQEEQYRFIDQKINIDKYLQLENIE